MKNPQILRDTRMLQILKMFTYVNRMRFMRISHSSHLGVTCHLYTRCGAALLLPGCRWLVKDAKCSRADTNGLGQTYAWGYALVNICAKT